MGTLVQTSVKFSTFKSIPSHNYLYRKQIFSFSPVVTKLAYFRQSGFRLRAYGERWRFLGDGRRFKNGVFLKERGCERKKRMVLAKQSFGFNGGGGGGRDNGATARLLVNLALAIGLTYLSMTGQLGWILDAIVSIWIMPFFQSSIITLLQIQVVYVPLRSEYRINSHQKKHWTRADQTTCQLLSLKIIGFWFCKEKLLRSLQC